MPSVVRHRQVYDIVPLAGNVYELALERISHVYDLFDHIVVSFSGGKDSTAVLNLTLEVARARGKLPLHVVFYDEEAIPLQTEEYVRRVVAAGDVDLTWYCLPVKHRNACSRKHPWWWPWAPEARDVWCRPLPPEGVTSVPGFPDEPERRPSIPQLPGLLYPPSAYGTVCNLLGIRAQESLIRRRMVTRRRVDNYIVFDNECETNRGNLHKAYPIYDWRTEDVWTAPKLFGWDYNCNPYEAPIWMADLSFKPIGEVQPGDRIVGWDTRPDGRAALRESTVLAVHKRFSSTVRVTLRSGRTLRCTPDHIWLTSDRGTGANWDYRPASIGRNLAHVIDVPGPVPDGLERTAAWLGGIYDGEGSYQRIYQHDRENGVYRAIQDALDALGIPYTALNGRSAAQHGFSLTGGRQGLVNFVNWTQPVRRAQLAALALGGRFREKDEVVSVEPSIDDEVYALTTTTGNYVCWGYASKNSAYDLMEARGMSIQEQRISPAFGEEPLQKLHTYADCFPEVWDRMTARVPGVNTAYRYARTELYAYRDRPQRQDGETWQDAVERIVNTHEPKVRRHIIRRLQEEIGRHYGKTDEPILDDAIHPHSGLSWEVLAMLAMRGDLKDRRQPGMKLSGANREEIRRKYYTALRAQRAVEVAEKGETGTDA